MRYNNGIRDAPVTMIKHVEMGKSELARRIRSGEIRLAGNFNLKIYGRLDCPSGKRMKKDNRVFFSTAADAIKRGFRPCGHCMRQEYQTWISGKGN